MSAADPWPCAAARWPSTCPVIMPSLPCKLLLCHAKFTLSRHSPTRRCHNQASVHKSDKQRTAPQNTTGIGHPDGMGPCHLTPGRARHPLTCGSPWLAAALDLQLLHSLQCCLACRPRPSSFSASLPTCGEANRASMLHRACRAQAGWSTGSSAAAEQLIVCVRKHPTGGLMR